MFFIFLIQMLKSLSIGYYLLYEQQTYLLCIILNNKNLLIKQFINDIAIDL